jgi:hypothetical protein
MVQSPIDYYVQNRTPLWNKERERDAQHALMQLSFSICRRAVLSLGLLHTFLSLHFDRRDLSIFVTSRTTEGTEWKWRVTDLEVLSCTDVEDRTPAARGTAVADHDCKEYASGGGMDAGCTSYIGMLSEVICSRLNYQNCQVLNK